jgi:hypothetical protein
LDNFSSDGRTLGAGELALLFINLKENTAAFPLLAKSHNFSQKIIDEATCMGRGTLKCTLLYLFVCACV